MNILQHIEKEFEKSKKAIEKVNQNDTDKFRRIIKKKQDYFKKLCNFHLTFFAKCDLLNKYPNGIFDAEDERNTFLLLKEKLNSAKELIHQANDIDDYAEIQQVDIKNYTSFLTMAAYSLNMTTLYSLLYNKVENFSIGTYLAINKVDESADIVIGKSYELMGYWTAKNEMREAKRHNVLKGSRVPQIKETLRELLAKYDYTHERIALLDMRKLKAGFRTDIRKLAESLGLSYRSITNRLREIRNEERKKIKTR
jgi:hypothetical protein